MSCLVLSCVFLSCVALYYLALIRVSVRVIVLCFLDLCCLILCCVVLSYFVLIRVSVRVIVLSYGFSSSYRSVVFRLSCDCLIIVFYLGLREKTSCKLWLVTNTRQSYVRMEVFVS